MSARDGFTAPPVWELAKHDGRLIAGEREYKGRSFFELRLWTGEHGDKATHKGVTMPLDAVADLARALAAYKPTHALSGPENSSKG